MEWACSKSSTKREVRGGFNHEVHHVEGDIENVLWRAVALSFFAIVGTAIPPLVLSLAPCNQYEGTGSGVDGHV